MARVCDTIYPAGILTGSGNIQIPNFEDLVKSYDDPLYRYDLKQLSILSVLLNTLLSTIDLTNFPNLRERLDSDDDEGGIIGFEELANVLNETGIDPSTMTDAFLSDFPVEINLDLLDYLVTELDDALTLDPDIIIDNEAEITNEIINNAPVVIPDATPFDYSINPWVPSFGIFQILYQFEDYYSDTLADVYTSTVCDGIFKVANGFLSVVSTIRDIILGISSILTKISSFLRRVIDLYTIAQSFITNFNNFIGMLDQGITQVISALKEVIKEKIAAFTTSISKLSDSIGEGINQVTKLSTSLSSINSTFNSLQDVQNAVDQINANLMKFYNQYVEPWPEIINKVAQKACQILRAVEKAMRQPIEFAKALVREAIYRTDIYEAYSAAAQDLAALSGGLRLPLSVRLGERYNSAITLNNRTKKLPGSINTDPIDDGIQDTLDPELYIPLQATEGELNYIRSMTENGLKEFSFSESVKEMGNIATGTYMYGRDDPTYKGPVYACSNRPEDHYVEWDAQQNKPHSGWSMILNKHPYVYVALRRVAARLGKKLLITSAYRSPYYNRIVLRKCRGKRGAAYNSPHMSAMAIDVSSENLTKKETALFIKYCSQEGFNRISVYNTFVHVDIQSGPGRGNWTQNYDGSNDIKRAIEMHIQRQHTDGPL
jgi:hypothetical protein